VSGRPERLVTGAAHDDGTAPAVTRRRSTITLVDGIEVVATELGDPDAPGSVHVLVHGIGVSGRYFGPLAEALGRTHRVLIPDLPGFGRSPRPREGPTIQDMAAAVRGYLGAAHVEDAVLVGHSMGSQVVAEVMVQAPGLVRRGVLIGAVTDNHARTVVRQAVRLARDGLHEPPRVNALLTADFLRAGPRWYSAMLAPMLGYRTEDAVARIADELLLVRGEKDPVCTQRWQDELTAHARHGWGAVVPGAGHVVMYTEPDAVADLCRAPAPVR
jgi:pimeloyl-ACP methyl ester carboxylesterase